MKPLRGHSLSNPDRSVCVFDVTVMKCGETVRFGFYSRPHSLYSLVHSPTTDLSIGSDPQEPHALTISNTVVAWMLRMLYKCNNRCTIFGDTANAAKAPVLACPKGHHGTQLHNIWAMLSYFTSQLCPAVFSDCDELCLKAAIF